MHQCYRRVPANGCHNKLLIQVTRQNINLKSNALWYRIFHTIAEQMEMTNQEMDKATCCNKFNWLSLQKEMIAWFFLLYRKENDGGTRVRHRHGRPTGKLRKWLSTERSMQFETKETAERKQRVKKNKKTNIKDIGMFDGI